MRLKKVITELVIWLGVQASEWLNLKKKKSGGGIELDLTVSLTGVLASAAVFLERATDGKKEREKGKRWDKK